MACTGERCVQGFGEEISAKETVDGIILKCFEEMR
jgi:hypothetical protein